MNVLIINQFFWPDSAPTGILAADVAVELVRRGHRVTVLCGGTEYSQTAASERPPVEIVRVSGTSFRRTTGGRLLSWSSFLAGSMMRSLLLPRFDLVLTMTTPPGLALTGVLLKRLRRTKLCIWEMDLYPDVAAATGALSPTSLMYRSAANTMYWARAQADWIIALGECMKSRLMDHGLPAENLSICENWADSSQIKPKDPPPTPPLRILYSGNLGLAHEIETISQAMLRLREDPRFHFFFAGGGALREELKRFCLTNRLTNVEFRPYCEQDRFSESLGSCHIGLVTLNNGCQGAVVPSKAYALMAAARPVLFIGPHNSTSALLVQTHGSGWQIQPGDVSGAVALLESLAQSPEQVREAGRRAYHAFTQNYDKAFGVVRVADVLEAIEE